MRGSERAGRIDSKQICQFENLIVYLLQARQHSKHRVPIPHACSAGLVTNYKGIEALLA